VQTPEHKAFYLAYHRKYNDHPRLGSVVGYSMIHALAVGIGKAKSTETEKLIAAFSGMTSVLSKRCRIFRPTVPAHWCADHSLRVSGDMTKRSTGRTG
jgi:branched-chain amino acid transport system substrate-binding protein